MANSNIYLVQLIFINLYSVQSTCVGKKLVTIRLKSFDVVSDVYCDKSSNNKCDLWFRMSTGSTSVLFKLPDNTNHFTDARRRYNALSYAVPMNAKKITLQVQLADHDGHDTTQSVCDGLDLLQSEGTTCNTRLPTAWKDTIEIDVTSLQTKIIERQVNSVANAPKMDSYVVTLNYSLLLKIETTHFPIKRLNPTKLSSSRTTTTRNTTQIGASTTPIRQSASQPITQSGQSISSAVSNIISVTFTNYTSSGMFGKKLTTTTEYQMNSNTLPTTLRTSEQIGQTIKLMLAEDNEESDDIDGITKDKLQTQCTLLASAIGCVRCSVTVMRLQKTHLPVKLLQSRRKRAYSKMFLEIRELLLSFFMIKPFELMLQNGMKIKIVGKRPATSEGSEYYFYIICLH